MSPESKLASYLSSLGILTGEDEFVGLVRESFERLGLSTASIPEDGLPASEAELLVAGGLSPVLPPGARDPVLGHALELAAILSTSLTVEQAAGLLRVNGSRVRQRLTAHPPSLYGVKHGRAWRLPRFQFSPHGELPGIRPVLAALDPALGPVAIARWLTFPNPDLALADEEPRSPLAWISSGRSPSPVVALAREL